MISKNKKMHILHWLNVHGFFGTLIVNILANTIPFNGKTVGDISDSYPNLFVPADLTFSIWRLIYLSLGLFAIFQLKTGDDYVEQIDIFFFISCIGTIVWIFAWHYELILLSLIMMLLILSSLITIYIRLEIGKEFEKLNKEKLLFHIPFSIYLGWITVATIANVAILAIEVNWNRWGLTEQFWAVLVIVIAVIITSLMLIFRKDLVYSSVIIWALLGIYLKRIDPLLIPEPLIARTALISIIILLTGMILLIIIKRKKYFRS